MKVYIAKCTTSDPEIPDFSNTITLRVFSTKKLAKNSFTRKENRIEKDGQKWISEHICFRGDHEIEEYELDKGYSHGV